MIMKNQLLNLKMIALMCLMMVLGGANAWAESKTYNYIFKSGDFSTSKLTSTLNGVTWTLKVNQWNGSQSYAFDNDKGFKIGASNSKYPKDATLSTSEIDGTITSIVVNTSGNSSTTAKLDVRVGGKAFGKQQSLSSTATDFSFNGSASGQIELKYSNSNKPIYIKSIAVTYETAPDKNLTSLAISGQPTKTTYDVGEEFDPTGLVVKGTYDDNTTATITNGITWTKNPETLSLGNTSCTVTASVGEVKSEPFVVNGLNVVKAIVFDFTKDWEGITATAATNNQTDGEQVVAGKELKVDGVVMTATNKKTSTNTIYTGLYTSKDAQTLRVYGSVTFTAPEGYNLSEVTFTGSSTDKFTTADEAYKNPTWTGNAHAVTFTASSSVQVKTVTIKLVAAAGPTYTAQTLTFIAKDGADYYATFSNDKVTFITSNHVIPYVVTVANGKVEMNSEMFKSEKTTIESAEVDGYYIPANTGILLYSDAENVDYYTVENKTVDAISPTDNMLEPAPKDGGVFAFNEAYKYYKLAYNDYKAQTGLGFYWGANNGGAFYVKGGTAYLKVLAATTAGAKGFTLNGEATGIEGVNANVENAKAIYNLNGQRVASMAKPGLYIVNGKKVVRK